MQNRPHDLTKSKISLSPIKFSKEKKDIKFSLGRRPDLLKNLYMDNRQHSGSPIRKLDISNSQHSIKSCSYKRSQRRLDNLNLLLDKCTNFQKIKTKLPLISQMDRLRKLRKSIEECEITKDHFRFGSEKELKKDSIELRNNFLRQECLRGDQKYIRRFKSIRVHRKTDKIVAIIASKLALNN